MAQFAQKKQAFSLVEVAMVIIITGILLAAVMQATDMIRSFRIMGARAQTKSSPVNGIAGIVAWYDATSDRSFNKKEAVDGIKVSYWNDINSQSAVGSVASQESNTSRPTYTFDPSVANGLPVLRFDGNDFFNLPDGTVPDSNYDYTFFFVMCVPTTGESFGVLGSGDSDTENGSNMISYRAGGFAENNWQKNSLLTQVISVAATKMQVFTFFYDSTTGRKIFVNGTFKGEDKATNRRGLPTRNTIGKVMISNIPDMYFKGDIGEIILFGRALSKEERQMVEKYLAKKWAITL